MKQSIDNYEIKVSSFDSFSDLLDTKPYFSAIMTTICIGERSGFLLHMGSI